MRVKKLLCLLMASVLSLSTLTVSAAEVGSTQTPSRVEDSEGTELFSTTDADWEYQGGTSVKYFNDVYDASVLVTIPKLITLSEEKTAGYDVSVKGHMEYALGVSVEPHDDYPDTEGVNFAMSAEGENDVLATVVQPDTVWSQLEVTEEGTAKLGSVSAPGLSRGDWNGTLKFDINMSERYGSACNKKDLTDPKHNWVNDVCEVCGACRQVDTGYGYYELDGTLVRNWDSLVKDYGLDVSTDYGYNVDELSTSLSNILVTHSDDFPAKGELRISPEVTKLGTLAFAAIDNKEYVRITIPSSVSSISDSTFRLSSSIAEFKVAEDSPHYKSSNGDLFNKDMTTLIKHPQSIAEPYDIPEGVTLVGSYACEGSELMSVDLPASLTGIGAYAFSNCSNLLTADLSVCPNLVTMGGLVFVGSKNLLAVDLGNVSTQTSMSFTDCTGLKAIWVNPGLSSVRYLMTGDGGQIHDLFYGTPSTMKLYSSITGEAFDGKLNSGGKWRQKEDGSLFPVNVTIYEEFRAEFETYVRK